MGDLFLNLDLNQQPVLDPSPSQSSPPAIIPSGLQLGFSSDEHETQIRPIEDRIRLAIRASARNPQKSSISVIEPVFGATTCERFRNHKRDITHLARALEMDLDSDKTDDGVLFDCNICLNTAKDPILTCCGHLFCWGCFYQVPYVDSISKECPVCYGEVIDSNVTPVYGNGNGNGKDLLELDSGVKIPPRPQAHRVESIGLQSLFVRRIGNGLGNSEGSSVVHASVNISIGDQRYGVGTTGLQLGGFAEDGDGDVEVDLDVSRSRRRRRLR